MYHRPVSPNRPIRTLPSQYEMRPDRSRSPANQIMQVSPSQGNMPTVVNNLYGPPPPGMQTVLKPKIFEAVEVPANSLVAPMQTMQQTLHNSIQNTMMTARQNSQVVVADPEQSKRIAQLEHELNVYRNRVFELSQIANELNPEYEKLSHIISEKANEIEQLREERKYLQEQIRQLSNQNTINEYSDQSLRQLRNELDDQKRILIQMEGSKQNAENKCRILEEELERSRNLINEAIKETEVWRQKYHQEDLDKLGYNQRISQLEVQNLHQTKDIDRLTLSNLQKQQEVEGLRQRVNQLEYQQLNMLQPSQDSELRRLRDQMEARNKEVENLRQRKQELEQYCIKMKEIEVEHDILQKRYLDLEKNISDTSKYKHLYEQLQLEFENQKQKLNKADQALQEQKRAEYRLQSEIQRLGDLLRVKDEELARQAQDYKRNLSQQQNQVNLFKEQYEKDLQSAYSSKNRNDNEFRENMERKFNIMKDELENQRKEREQLLQTCSQLSQTKIQLENKIVLLTGEIERLNQVIRSKYEEQQVLKENYRSLNDQLEQSQAYVEDLKKESEMLRSRGGAPSFRSPNQRAYAPYENSHKGSMGKPYDSQRQSQKQFDINSHQQDFS